MVCHLSARNRSYQRWRAPVEQVSSIQSWDLQERSPTSEYKQQVGFTLVGISLVACAERETEIR
jgi:hypothetical protein